jgi:hypothetical protein
VSPAELEAVWLDVLDLVGSHGGIAFPPYVLWHSKFKRGDRSYYPGRRWEPLRARQKTRARRRREAMLRDTQRILERCSTTAQS